MRSSPTLAVIVPAPKKNTLGHRGFQADKPAENFGIDTDPLTGWPIHDPRDDEEPPL